MGLRDRNRYHDKNIFFITTTCHQWLSLISIGNGFNIISESLNYCRKKFSAAILSYVLMPNHIHLILHFNNGSKRMDFMRDFKKFTSTMIRKEVEFNRPEILSRLRDSSKTQIFKVWQDRYDEVYLENKKLTEIKLDYIHNNPLQEKWQLAQRPEDYPYSSARYYELDEQPQVIVTHYMEFL